MNLDDSKKLLKQISVAKKLPDALYVHESAFNHLPQELFQLIERVGSSAGDYNIIKFHRRGIKLSFLWYPEFFENPHPALKRSYSIDFSSGASRVIDYHTHSSPPILHRKELFVPEDHADYEKFLALSVSQDKADLFEKKKTIGFL